MNRSKAIGTRAESAVVKAARANGFPMAERVVLHGSLDQGDIKLLPGLTAGVIVEVKGGEAAKTASPAQIEKWMLETETEVRNAGAVLGFLVTQRRGIGEPRAGEWAAHIRHQDLLRMNYEDFIGAPNITIQLTLNHILTLLRAAGYGDPI